MTRAASNRKHSSGSTASSRPGPVFRGRDVVFVDPLDDKESYWWPAMIVPVAEIDSTMDCRILNPGECLVKYFEDNKYSVVPFADLQLFVPTTIPFLEFELAAGQKFLKNSGVLNAMSYLETGKVKRKFSWNRFGTAQDQDLSLDLHKHKAIALPLVSDEIYSQSLAGSSSTTGALSPASSSTDHETENGDPTAINVADNVNQPPHLANTDTAVSNTSGSTAKAPSIATSPSRSNLSAKGEHLKNGLQRPLATTASGPGALPSPVSLEDLAATTGGDQTGTEFRVRRGSKRAEGGPAVTSAKDSAATKTQARSRRGSRDDAPNNNNGQPSPTPSSSSSASGLRINTADSGASTAATNGSPVSLKRALSETMRKPGSTSGRSSRQGSVEPASSPRSTRHSSRGSKTTEDSLPQSASGDNFDSAVDESSSLRIKTQRMSRTRSAPKNGSSLSPSSTHSPTITQNGKIWGTAGNATLGQTNGSAKGSSGAKTVDTPEGKDLVMASTANSMVNGKTEVIESTDMSADRSSLSRPPSSIVSSSASSTSSPSSIGVEETTGATSILHFLDQDRQTVIYSFDNVLPTLAIGSKEREAIYETCMEHLQKLRREHRRLKEVLKGSEFLFKGRRATRSSPHYATLQQNAQSRAGNQDRVNSPGRASKNANSNSSSSHSNTQQDTSHSTATTGNGSASENGTGATKTERKSSPTPSGAAASASSPPEAQPSTPPSPPRPPVFTGSTPSSAILTSNISATTRRSAAAAAAIAVTATINRGRGGYNKNSDSASKKRNAAAMAAASSTAAGEGSETRSKRRTNK
ncbi:hypothetical protein EMPS_10489 [Entomortierella parvispora]|uniref:PWWP domain-containing protein n=1 Tax=Entomortierella parvispora TaxID=205924 RepID=A0A9P3M1K9_9FUNG|nr:hypothetical protein EMPS_10489 [Entomortierella parvispora]